MDFFQRQEIARRNTKLLEVYFALAVIAIVLTVYLAIALIETTQNDSTTYDSAPETAGVAALWNPDLFLAVTLGTLAIIGCGSLYKTAQLAGGGKSVAEMLGGQPIDAHTTDPREQKLLNVVEEMAIASGTPVPQIYLLPGEQGINAFAAGHSTGDMVICVTGGALKYLTRDELQGVIGHEFSHILNGDMRLNLRLMGIVFGILCLAVIGRIFLYTRGDRKNPLPIIGIILLLVGSIGVFFAKLIKSAVSRQREFLADASSVQFTRNPSGLADALKKVGSGGSRIADPNAEDASHFFFANGLKESFFGWMSTHPPLEERIRELDPAWDGKFIPLHPVRDESSGADRSAAKPPPPPGFAPLIGNLPGGPALAGGLGAAVVLASSDVLPQTGAPTARHLDYASDLMAKLPEPLAAAAREPMTAIALIYALLLSPDETIRKTQLAQLQANAPIYQETTRLLPALPNLDPRARLPLATLSITALRALSPAQYAQFSQTLQALMNGGPTDLFAYVLQKIVLRRLEPAFHPPDKSAPKFNSFQPLLTDCSVLLSAVACAGQTEPAAIASAFNQGARQLILPPGAKLQLDTTAYDLNKIDSALNRLSQGTPAIKKAILNACAETVAADGVIQENEAELLRAIADTLDCPIPPFLSL
jgi:Zn-dependent protease with chaperone function